MHDFVMAVPWPDFIFVGVPAFASGVMTGRLWGARRDKRRRR